MIYQEFLDRRKMTEWGSLSLVDDGEGDVAGKSISLPGVRSGDLSSRHWKPQVRVSCVQFSPTGNMVCLSELFRNQIIVVVYVLKNLSALV